MCQDFLKRPRVPFTHRKVYKELRGDQTPDDDNDIWTDPSIPVLAESLLMSPRKGPNFISPLGIMV